MSELFTPITLRRTTVRNRVWVAPMCQYSAVDGVPNDWHLVHLGSFARGGAGLVLTEATAVVPEGRISPEDTGLWNDEQQQAWARIVAFVHGQGATAGIQLAHAGRKASTFSPFTGRGSVPEEDGGWETVGPSAAAFPGYRAPRQLTEQEIGDVVAAFAASARRALAAGFDVLEIHAAHGYLLHEFLSPLSNTRDDRYGGSFENRVRLLLEVVAAVRAAVPEDTPLLVRVSATDWVEGGWDDDQTVRLAGLLREAGVDLVDTSTGGNAPADIPLGPGYQVRFARRVRQEAGIPSGAVGLITEAKQAEEVVADGSADVVLLARALLRDPHWPLRAAHELGVPVGEGVDWPKQYLRAALD
jgi:2,4-dienoyl-CoA reductase-like NADH-dependent reductase (Old Yellow Enzyme family)